MTDHPLAEKDEDPPLSVGPVVAAPVALPPAMTEDWSDIDGPGSGGGFSVGRLLLALRRFWWLIVLFGILGVGGAYAAYTLTVPEYTAGATILVTSPTRQSQEQGAIQAEALMEETSLLDLLRNPLVTHPVILRERLYLSHDPKHAELFQDFALDTAPRYGSYRLTTSPGGWTLRNDATGIEATGQLGEPIGGEFGFDWNPPLSSADGSIEVTFTVVPARDAATRLGERLQAFLNRQGNFINVILTDKDPEVAARVLNGIIRSFERTADSLKVVGLERSLESVERQADQVASDLASAREALEAYQIQIITEPSDRDVALGAGIVETRAPIINEYQDMRSEKRELDADRERLAQILATIPDSGVPIPQLELIDPAARSSELLDATGRLASLRTQRRQMLQVGTEDYPPLIRLNESIRVLEEEEIPQLLGGIIAALDITAGNLQARIDSTAVELQGIPERMSREDALRQEVAAQEALAEEVGRRRQMQTLIFRSSIEEFQVLNEATVPFTPSSDQRIPLAGAVFLGFLGAGLAGAVLLDRFDSRFRYPEDLAQSAGVEVLGMVPRMKGVKTKAEVEEAFRDLRMRVMYAHGTAGPLMVTISSPGPGEGKTLVSANLGLAFAQVGRRTLLIDGDVRRGDLHRLVGGERSPGLVDFLAGASDGRIIHRTEYPNLHFMGAGARLARAPELLAGERVRHLFARLQERYDVILVDAPPLAVGADSFHLATLTGSMALVVRAGASEKAIVEKKLQALAGMPVRVLGGILNDVSSSALKGYGYYSYYVPGYETGEEELVEEVAALVPAAASDLKIPDE